MPGPRGGRPMQKPKNAGATIRRVVKYLSEYKFFLLVVTVAIIFSALASVIGTSYMKTIIDDYIEPMVHNYSDELMHGFILTLLRMGSVYLIGGAVHLHFGQNDAACVD